jgi:hypothetical protein
MLPELQRRFAAALHDRPCEAESWAADDGIAAAARLRVYRGNARAQFEQALAATFPVLQGRVGEDYFRQLAHHYREAHPSRAGDLHEVGRAFAPFLADHLADGPYAWLAELAALEWTVAEAGVAADTDAVSVTALAGVPAEALTDLRLRFVASFRCIEATVPVLSVWRSGQAGGAGVSIDLATGPEFVLLHRAGDEVQLVALSQFEHAFVAALVRDRTLGDALDASMLEIETLPGLLHRLFSDGAVAAVLSADDG